MCPSNTLKLYASPSTQTKESFLNLRVGMKGMKASEIASPKAWMGYNIVSGTASKEGAVALPNTCLAYQSDSMARLSVATSSSTLEKTQTTRVSVGGSFLGFDFGTSSEQKTVVNTESTTASINIFYKSNVISHIIPIGEELKMTDEATQVIDNQNWKEFKDRFGTHVVTSRNYGCFTNYEVDFKFSKFGAAKTFRDELNKMSLMQEPSKILFEKIKALAQKCDPAYKWTLDIDGNFNDKEASAIDDFVDLPEQRGYAARCREWVGFSGDSSTDGLREEALFSVYARPYELLFSQLQGKLPVLDHDSFESAQDGVIMRDFALKTYRNISSRFGDSSPWSTATMGYTGCYNEEGKEIPVLGPLNTEFQQMIKEKIKRLEQTSWISGSTTTEEEESSRFLSNMLREASITSPVAANQLWPFYYLRITSDNPKHKFKPFELSYDLYNLPSKVYYSFKTGRPTKDSKYVGNTSYIEVSPYAGGIKDKGPFQYSTYDEEGKVSSQGFLNIPRLLSGVVPNAIEWISIPMTDMNGKRNKAINAALVPNFSSKYTNDYPIYVSECVQ